jgi:hypothetical protein
VHNRSGRNLHNPGGISSFPPDRDVIACQSHRPVSVLFQLENVYSHVVKPLEDFRKKCIGGVKNEKKKFEKQTAKFCQCQERYLNLTTKKPNSLQEVCFVFNLECGSRFERVLHETRHRIFAGLGTCKISTSHLRRKCLFWASNKTKK